MKKTLPLTILSIFILIGSLLPLHMAQAKPIVPDCGKMEKVPEVDGDGKPVYRGMNGNIVPSSIEGEQRLVSAIARPCDFNYLMQLANNVINFLLFVIATPLVAIIICYAGFLMITSGGSSERATKAKSIMGKIVFGYIIALVAWLVVSSILKGLGFTGEDFLEDAPITENIAVAPTPPAPQPAVVADSGIYIGGSYDEENPDGNTCSIYLPSKPIVQAPQSLLQKFAIQRAEAEGQTPEQKQLEQRAAEFRKARCWLIDWYKRREVPNFNSQNVNLIRYKYLANLKTVPFEIYSRKTYEQKFGKNSGGRSYPGIELLVYKTEGKIVIMDNGTPIVLTSIHELTHHSEDNGRVTPMYQKKSMNTVFSKGYIDKYFSDFINADPKYWLGENYESIRALTVSPQKRFYDLWEGPQFFYCYIIKARGLSSEDPCYTIYRTTQYNTGGTTLTGQNKYEFETYQNVMPSYGSWIELGTDKIWNGSGPQLKSGSVFIDNNYTEVTARMMEFRYTVGAEPDELFPNDYKIPKSFQNEKLFRIPYMNTMYSFFSADRSVDAWPRRTYTDGDKEGGTGIPDLIKTVSFSIIAQYHCDNVLNYDKSDFVRNPNKSDFIIQCNHLSADGEIDTKSVWTFNSVEEANNWMADLITVKVKYLMNNAI